MIRGVKRPCLTCGALTDEGSWCPGCSAQRERERSARRGRRHYDAAYTKRAKQVRANAVECWICHEGPRDGDPWTADHLYPGDSSPSTPLLPAHRSCNSRRGDRPIESMWPGHNPGVGTNVDTNGHK